MCTVVHHGLCVSRRRSPDFLVALDRLWQTQKGRGAEEKRCGLSPSFFHHTLIIVEKR